MTKVLTQGKIIWDNARITDRPDGRFEFPDLIRFKDHWYCAFREAVIHNNHPSGRGRIIRSSDGKNWDTVTVLDWDCGDVREPKFSITAEGCLMVSTSVYFVSREPRSTALTSPAQDRTSYTPPEARQASDDHPDRYYQLDWLGTTLNLADHDGEPMVAQQSVTWLSRDGLNWSSAYTCPTGVNSWRWGVKWHDGMGYSVAQWGKDTQGTLYRTRDAKNWRVLTENIFPQEHGGETALAFNDHGAVALLRGNNRSKVFLGTAAGPSFQNWSWREPMIDWEGDGNLKPASQILGVGVGGPTLLRLRDGRFIGAGRVLGPGSEDGRVTLFLVDAEKNVMKRFATCDGTSYPGLAEHDGEIWVTYIGSLCHQNEWEVRLAKLPLPDFSPR